MVSDSVVWEVLGGRPRQSARLCVRKAAGSGWQVLSKHWFKKLFFLLGKVQRAWAALRV